MRAFSEEVDFFIWIGRNPLKKPISAKGIQGYPSFFPCISLDLLALIWSEFAPLVVWPWG
jgi:hypothetical protein